MRITVFRGTKEIGGTCIEVAAGNTRVILDTGTPLVNADRSPFDARVMQNRSVDELLTSGILPSVPGLFRADSPPPTAILLSHAHLDHVGLLPYSVPTIPVYATSGTSKMMLAGSIFSRQFQLDRKRHRTVNDGQSFSVGEITITPLAVDHSTYGSVAFLLRAESESVLYSGDLRLHGRKPGMFRSLLNEVSGHRVDVLLAEGTHLGSEQDQGLSEQELETQIVSGIGETKGLILVCFSPLDLDRLVTFYRSAVRTRRTFVADAYTAFVLHLVASRVHVPRPTRENGIRVFYPHAFTQRNITKLTRLFANDRIELAEILDRPEQFLMVFRPSMIHPDFGGNLPLGCRVIYSSWEGYLRNPDWVDLHSHVSTANGVFVAAHASGHIYPADLAAFVQAVNPRRVVPIHTFEPDRMRDLFPDVFLPADGETFEVSG